MVWSFGKFIFIHYFTAISNLRVPHPIELSFVHFFVGLHVGNGITNVGLQMLNCLWIVGIALYFNGALQKIVKRCEIVASWRPIDIIKAFYKRNKNKKGIWRTLYVCNFNIHKDFCIPTIQEEIKKFAIKYDDKLTIHHNALARQLLGPIDAVS